jgi:hypothetical protein
MEGGFGMASVRTATHPMTYMSIYLDMHESFIGNGSIYRRGQLDVVWQEYGAHCTLHNHHWATSFILGGRLHEAGGFHASGQSSVERYDTVPESRIAIANMNHGLYNLCAVMINSTGALVAKASGGSI